MRRNVPRLVGAVLAAVLCAAGIAAMSGSRAAAGSHLGGARPPLGGGHVAGVISTVAGGGRGGPARGTAVGLEPCGATVAGAYAYLADGQTVHRLNADSDWLVAVAGAGTPYVPAGDGGPAAKAGLSTCGVAVDGAGNLVIADKGHDEVRVVAARSGVFYGVSMKRGHIYAVAGDGSSGYSGDGGPAIQAELWLGSSPGVAVDGSGNLVIADFANNRVRVVAASTGTFYGIAMTAGDIYTVAGDGTGGYSGDGGRATGAELSGPAGVAVDAAGNLVIADNPRVRVVAASSGTFYGIAMTAGDIYTVAGDGTGGYSGDGGPATQAELAAPSGVAVDGSGNLVIADSGNDRVRVVAARTGTFYGIAMTAGDIYTVAGDGDPGYSGDGGPAAQAELSAPSSVAVAGSGNLVIADSGNDRVRVVAASTGTFYGIAMTAGDIYTAAGDGTEGYSGDGGPATKAELDSFPDYPFGVAVDRSGNLVIADAGNNRVRVVAARTGTFYGIAMTAGDIYTVAGNGGMGYSGDGGPATQAGVFGPSGVAVDAAGNLVIADSGNNRVRVVAASTGTFYGIAMTAGDIYTVAGNGTERNSGDGGPATKAALDNPVGVAVAGSGNLVIDVTTNRIRVVAASSGTFYGIAMTAGDIYTVAGDGTGGFSGDGGPATKAKLHHPYGVAADGSGNLIIADTINNRIRVVAASTGTFYGIAMTAGDIYTVAGHGGPGYSGDGGPATKAKLGDPLGVAVGAAGNLVIADSGSNRIREVTG